MKETAPLFLYDLTRAELAQFLQEHGFRPHHAELIWEGLYRQQVMEIGRFSNLPAPLLTFLAEQTTLRQPTVQAHIRSTDGYTDKYLIRPNQHDAIETVIMAFNGRYTACISTQVGCAMGCVFCATGQMGFTRHLSAGEIVTQLLFVQRQLAERGQVLRNVVLMGMGEPLHNYDNTMKAIAIATDHKGLSLAHRFITLSTVGLPHQIRRMADEAQQVRLAVSLHGATDEERIRLVPPAKRWPLAEVLDACRYYCLKRQRHIFFEWALIAGENDQLHHAHQLGQLLHDIPATINVIPLNPTTGYGGAPSEDEAVRQFCHILRQQYGLRCTVRQRRGIDISAGCGQLAIRESAPR